MRSTDELVELHDKVLRGDGGDKLGLVALVTNLCIAVDDLKSTVHSMELAVARAKGWVAGATAMGAATGAFVTWLLEKFLIKH